ncbi:Hypp4738 [Branchiostoma lanceolatum]|uniref:Hypp4738 protein n=1 Tax=Branchiostoma lanceolatum TaxID=7740 RepID=A0A8K0ABS1_BRALA|nr:Hypp4738 [Branchiostoma lanceolatum]
MSTVAPVTNVTSAAVVPWIQTVPAVFTILGCIFLFATILICLNLTFCKAWWERSCSCCGRTGFEKVVDEDDVEATLWLPDGDVTRTQNKRSTDIYKVPLVDEAWQDGGHSSRLDGHDGHTEEELRGLVMSAGVKGSRLSLRSGLVRHDDVSRPGSHGDVRANSTELIDLEEEDTLGPIRPDTAGSLRPDTAGSLRPGTVGSVRPDTAGSQRPDTAGSMRPDTAGSLRPGTAGSLRPGTGSSLRSDTGRSSARLRRPVSAGSEGRPETAEERWGRKPEGLIEEEERQKLLATLPLRQREELQYVTSLVEVRARVERWKNKNRMKRRQHRVEPGLPSVETMSTSSDTLSSGSGDDHLQSVREQWMGSRHLLSSTTLGTADSPTVGSPSTSARSARSIEIEPRQNGHQLASFVPKSPPKTSTSNYNRLEIISEDDSLESRIGRATDAHVRPTYGRHSKPASALSMSSWGEYSQWAASVSSRRPGAGASRQSRLTDDTALPRSGGSRSSTTPTVYRYSFRGSDLLTRQTSKGRTVIPFPEQPLADLPDLLPGSVSTTAAKDTFGWVNDIPIPTDSVSPPVPRGRGALDAETSSHGSGGTTQSRARAPPPGGSTLNYTPSSDFRHSGQS